MTEATGVAEDADTDTAMVAVVTKENTVGMIAVLLQDMPVITAVVMSAVRSQEWFIMKNPALRHPRHQEYITHVVPGW
ncbi:hypothetical protein GCM10022209_29650 [Chitinophaga oryziterrae]